MEQHQKEEIPTFVEVKNIIGKLKNKENSGEDNIQEEIIQYRREMLRKIMYDIIKSV